MFSRLWQYLIKILSDPTVFVKEEEVMATANQQVQWRFGDRLTQLHKLQQLGKDIYSLASAVPDALPTAEKVFTDILSLVATKSGTSLIALINDMESLIKEVQGGKIAISVALAAIRQDINKLMEN